MKPSRRTAPGMILRRLQSGVALAGGKTSP